MNDFPDPNPQEETDQPAEEPAVTGEPEDYTAERMQEFLAADTLTPDQRAKADARLNHARLNQKRTPD
jgi:hypothetical protein